VNTGRWAELVPVNVHAKSLKLPGATICDSGTTPKLLESGPSGPMSKNAITESRKDCSAAFADVLEIVNSRPPRNSMAAKCLMVVIEQGADRLLFIKLTP